MAAFELLVSDLRAGYEERDVLRGLSFTLRAGETLSVIGPNGCGKTTLLRVLAGLLPYAGSASLDGCPISSMKRRELSGRVALMSQLSGAYFSYTVHETVLLGRYARSRGGLLPGPDVADRAFADDCLRAVDMYDLRDRDINRLSGGQLQRVFLARAMAQDPDIILLDEPTNHLDLRYQAELINYLRSFAVHKNRAVIGVFHDINMALSLPGAVVLMSGGQIAAMGGAEEIIGGGALSEVYGMDVRGYMRETYGKWR